MATSWNFSEWNGRQPSAAERLEGWLKGALDVNRAMETTLVDVVSAYTPWMASVIPAFIGFENVRKYLNFEPWQAWVYAIVVECLGLATVSTTLKFWSWNQTPFPSFPQMPQKAGDLGEGAARQKAPFWLAVATALIYLAITLSVNVLLDQGDWLVKLVKALASSFSVVGALVLAMRSQQGKAEAAVEAAQRATEQAKVEHQQRLDEQSAQRVSEARLIAEKELEALQLQQQKEMETFRLQAEERRKEKEAERNLRKELKLAEMQLKLAGNMAETGRKAGESFQKVAESEENWPETFGKWRDWRDVPETHKKRMAGMTPKQVRIEYGVPEKTSSNWVRKAVEQFKP